MPPTLALLQQQLEQNDEKHEQGHSRLRRDLTEGFNLIHDDLIEHREQIVTLKTAQASHAAQHATESRLSTQRAVILASVISSLIAGIFTLAAKLL